MPSRIRFVVAILCLLTAGSVWSQDTKGTITGRVTDPSGSVIPGAQVVVTNTAMGTTSALTTNAEGLYRAPALSPGVYQIEVVATGFKKALRPAIELRVAAEMTARELSGLPPFGRLAAIIASGPDAAVLETYVRALAAATPNAEVKSRYFFPSASHT